MQLNPSHPGWLWIALFADRYRARDYAGALDAALKINVTGSWYPAFALAATHGQLGHADAAQKVARQLHASHPGFAAVARLELAKWHEPDLIEHFVEGLRKAGVAGLPEARVDEKAAHSGAVGR